MKENIFEEIPVASTNCHQCSTSVHHWMECYNITRELDDDNPLHINIPESESMCAVEGAGMSSNEFLSPLKIKKVNIGFSENPKFYNIGDYYDNETVGNITELLYEFQDMFPTKFSKIKSIIGDLGEMKIPLRPDAKPVKQLPYRLNPHYKEKVKVELHRMLEAGVIEPVEELEWIKKIGV